MAAQFAERGEHHVEFSAEAGKVVKHTKDGRFGYHMAVEGEPGSGEAAKLSLRPALPEEYLDRLDAHNQVFGSDFEITGVASEYGLPGFTVTQTSVKGTYPTMQEVSGLMRDQGFKKLASPLFKNVVDQHLTWFHPESQMLVGDAKPENFLKPETGDLTRPVAIYLHVQHVPPGHPMHELLSKNTVPD